MSSNKSSHASSLKGIEKIDIIVLIVALIIVGSAIILTPSAAGLSQLKKFSSEDELKNYLKMSAEEGYYGYWILTTDIFTNLEAAVPMSTKSTRTDIGQGDYANAEDYSTTNIQVSGVDEADIVKNDGKYIYTIVGNQKIEIVDAFPAKQMKIVSEINITNASVSQIFVNDDKLVVFASEDGYYYPRPLPVVGMIRSEIMPPIYNIPKTIVNVYDISDRSNPQLLKNYIVNGYYYNSRMIGDYVYFITNQPVYDFENLIVPNEAYKCTRPNRDRCFNIWYFDSPDSDHQFTIISAFNVQRPGDMESKVFLMGYTQNLYVSSSNIYVTYTKYLTLTDFLDRVVESIKPLISADVRSQIDDIMSSSIFSNSEKMSAIGRVLNNYSATLAFEQRLKFEESIREKMENLQNELEKEMEKTIIHKIAIGDGKIEYKMQGSVPGNVLNQFSMDEYNGNLRIATTTEQWSNEHSKNHVYILDGSLNIIGKIEDLAPGERIYSARFLGDRGYLVTFRQIDPLFVIDLSTPYSPKVLGFLKILGVSDYLHPYDENHVIGIGLDATEEGKIMGMKISLFSIIDIENPAEISKYYIGERGTNSEALYDHKAFLFSKQKNLLVIPVNEVGQNWEDIWQGAYVFNINLQDGIILKGKIKHSNQTENESKYWYDYQSRIRRSLYMDDILYTVSQKMIKANSLVDLSEISNVTFSEIDEGSPIVY